MLLESTALRPVAAPRVEPVAPLVASLRPVVRAVVARVLRLPLGHSEVDDCVSETFRRVVENIGRVRPGEPVGPWAAGIARHVALDALRSRKRDRARSTDDDAA